MCHFHAHRHPGDLKILVAPVKLVSLSRREAQRDIQLPRINCRPTSAFALPASRVPAHCVIGTSKTIALQQVMNPAQPQPIPLRCPLVLFQKLIEALGKSAKLRARLRIPTKSATYSDTKSATAPI
jgi:hypothetical protein